MRWWDSSGLVPLFVEEQSSPGARQLYEADADVIVFWTTRVEVVSALARREREGILGGTHMREAMDRLEELAHVWQIQPTSGIRRIAMRLVRVHAIRAADSFQLAGAIVASEEHPESLPFVTLDERLAQAAAREGFPIERPTV